MGPSVYGMLVGVVIAVFTVILPQPAGSAIMWGLLSCQLSWSAVACWRRTGFPFATAAMVDGAVVSVCLFLLTLSGSDVSGLSREALVLLGGGTIGMVLLLVIEARTNPTKWRRWAQHMRHQTVWNIATGRHFPNLRQDGA